MGLLESLSEDIRTDKTGARGGHGRAAAAKEIDVMTDGLPDRLSTDPNSPHYDADLLAQGIGIRFKGEEKTNVEEYCVSESWVRVVAGNAKDRKGNLLTIKLHGTVEPYLRGPEA